MAERITVNSKKPASINENLISHRRKTDFRSNSSPVDRILYLQRTIGNQAVQRMVRSGALQAKLRIGQPGDVYEQEADRVADAVMRMPESGVQLQVVEPEEEEELVQGKTLETVQRQPEEKEEEEELMTKPGDERSRVGGSTATSDLETSIQQVRGRGQPLSNNTRVLMEQAFGADFSGVRVHADSESDKLNDSLQARAFTTGQDVFFKEGEYNPGSSSARELLAHELTHVVQQNRAKNSIKGSVATTIHQMSGESIYRACHEPLFAGKGGVKDGANWWYPHDFVGPLQVGDKQGAPTNIGYKVPQSPDASYNCMGWALSHAGIKPSWLQGVTRNSSHPWPEEELLVSKGCQKIKSSQTADHKVRLYEYKNKDQFHIVRQECDGLWSGKTGQSHLWRGITSPEKHTTSYYSQPLSNLKNTDWSCK